MFRRQATGLVFLALIATACGTYRSDDVRTSGFLGDYSMLREGGKGEAQLVYVNPRADFSRYDKILIEPVTVWAGGDSDLAEIPEQELSDLANSLRLALEDHLSSDYRIVKEPGPGTLRLRGALTEATDPSRPMRIISTALPVGLALSTAKRLTLGTHAFVGSAGAEMEIVDAESGERLAAAVDRQVGRKLPESLSTWSDVHTAFEGWAERIASRLREERARG